MRHKSDQWPARPLALLFPAVLLIGGVACSGDAPSAVAAARPVPEVVPVDCAQPAVTDSLGSNEAATFKRSTDDGSMEFTIDNDGKRVMLRTPDDALGTIVLHSFKGNTTTPDYEQAIVTERGETLVVDVLSVSSKGQMVGVTVDCTPSTLPYVPGSVEIG
jgi:hypothetical protein